MKRFYFILFLVLDFTLLVVIFLLFTYLGMCHLLLLFLGLLCLVMGIYDIRTGTLSMIIREFFKLPSPPPKKNGFSNMIPLILAVIVIWYSLPQVLEFGLINTNQSLIIRGNYFIQFTVWLTGFSFIIVIAAIISHLRKK